MEMSQPKCGVCGYSHPPAADGTCPMEVKEDKNGNVIDYNDLFTPLKPIIQSQVEMKNIKDVKKMFMHTIVEITRIMESYKE